MTDHETKNLLEIVANILRHVIPDSVEAYSDLTKPMAPLKGGDDVKLRATADSEWDEQFSNDEELNEMLNGFKPDGNLGASLKHAGVSAKHFAKMQFLDALYEVKERAIDCSARYITLGLLVLIMTAYENNMPIYDLTEEVIKHINEKISDGGKELAEALRAIDNGDTIFPL